MVRVTKWVVGIVGGIAAFLGLFIMFGPENEYLGLGGDTLTWRVGDIEAAWGYGLLIAGVVLLAATVALMMGDVRHPRARREQSEFAGLMWHTAIFVVVNAFLWIQDIAAGGGLEYAYWISIPWAVGLLSHAGAYLYSTRTVEEPVVGAVRETPSKELQHH